jgi:hypothetical protein
MHGEDPRVEDGVRHYEILHGETPPTSPEPNSADPGDSFDSYDHVVKTEDYEFVENALSSARSFTEVESPEGSKAFYAPKEGLNVRVRENIVEYNIGGSQPEVAESVTEFVDGIMRNIDGVDGEFRNEVHRKISQDYDGETAADGGNVSKSMKVGSSPFYNPEMD